MYKINNEYVLRKINDSYFLMSSGRCLNRKWLFQLNETGARIWKLCGTCNCFSELITRLGKIYNRKFIDTEEKSIYAYMNQLEIEGLIMREENGD